MTYPASVGCPADLRDQERCVELFTKLLQGVQEAGGDDELAKVLGHNVKYAIAHRDVIQRWGRFPHR